MPYEPLVSSRLILILFTLVTLAFVPNSFAQEASPQYVVRQIYFHPSDLRPPQDINATLDELVAHVQQFYADEMERHRFGRKTFRLETDAQGNPVRHFVEGKLTKEHYTSNEIGKANEEISEQFDRSAHLIYLIFINRYEPIPDFSQVGGNAVGHPFQGTANIMLSNYENAPGYLYFRAWQLLFMNSDMHLDWHMILGIINTSCLTGTAETAGKC